MRALSVAPEQHLAKPNPLQVLGSLYYTNSFMHTLSKPLITKGLILVISKHRLMRSEHCLREHCLRKRCLAVQRSQWSFKYYGIEGFGLR